MNKSIKYLGFSFLGAILFFSLGALRPFISSENGIGNNTTLTNPMTAAIKDLNGITRIIQVAGAASGFNDGSGASRIEADVGGSVKLKDATANSALEITSIGDAVFSHTAFLDTLLSPDLANTTGFYLSDVTYPGEILFYNSGIPTVSLSRNQSWFNAGSNYFSGVLHVVGKSIFDGTVNSTGTGGAIIDQTASNGVGHVVWKIAHNLPASYTNILDSTNFSPGWQWFVSSSNANGEIHWTSGPPSTASSGTTNLPNPTSGASLLTSDLANNIIWVDEGQNYFVNESFKANVSLFGGIHTASGSGVGSFADVAPIYLNPGLRRGFDHLTVTNTATTSYCPTHWSGNSVSFTNAFLGTNSFVEVSLGLECPVSGSLSNLGILIGFGNSYQGGTLAAEASFVGWVFRGNTNLNFQACTKVSGSTTIGGSFAMDTNSWPVLGCQVNTNTSTAIFYTNGVPMITNSANIPVGVGMHPFYCMQILGTNTSITFETNHMWVDWAKFKGG